MNILITLTTFLLIITTQLLMLHAQGFKEKENERQKTFSDDKMGENLTPRKRDADRIKKRALYDINGDGSIDYSLGSQGIGTRRRTDVNAESTPRRFNFGISSDLLGNTGRGNLAFDYTSPDYLRKLGNLLGDYNGNSEYQRALYRAYLLGNRGVENNPYKVGDLINYITGFPGKLVGGLDSAFHHAADTAGELLGINGEGGFFGSRYLVDGLSKAGGNIIDILSNGVHNFIDDASHLTHDILHPGANGNIGGSIGFQGSAGRFNPGFQGSADDRFNAGFQGSADGRLNPGFQGSAGGRFNTGFQGSADGRLNPGFQGSADDRFNAGFQGSADGRLNPGFQGSAGGRFNTGFQGSADGRLNPGFQGSADVRLNPFLQNYLLRNRYYN